MKKLKNKVFFVITMILTIFVISILSIYNYQNYRREKQNIQENLMQMKGEKKNFQKDRPEIIVKD